MMESIRCELSPENYDKAIHGGLDQHPVLPECGDLAIFIKPNATTGGNPAIALTFTVHLPDGSLARAQCAVTLKLFEQVQALIRGWKSGGHLR